jgi:Mn2+/Fe2+ NRAMP family transporter
MLGAESSMYEYHDGGVGLMFVVAVLFFLAMMTAIVGFAAWKIVATRRLAQRNGASDADATTLAVFGGTVGTAAAYLKPAVAGPGAPAVTAAPATREDLITEVRDLEAKGLITPEQADRRVDEILRGV